MKRFLLSLFLLFFLFSPSLFSQRDWGQSGSVRIRWSDATTEFRDSVRAVVRDSLEKYFPESGLITLFNAGTMDSTALVAANAYANADSGLILLKDTVTAASAGNNFPVTGDIRWEALPGAVIDAGAGLTLTGNVYIRGSPDDPLVILASGDEAFDLTPASIGSSTLADTLFPNNDNEGRIVVADGSQFTAGSIIKIESSVAWPMGNGNKGEVHKIRAVSNDTLWVYDKIYDSYDPAVETVTITEYPATKVHMENVIVKYTSPENENGIYLRYAADTYLDNVTVENAQAGGVIAYYQYNARFFNVNVYGANTTNLGYGIWIGASNRVLIEGCSFFGCSRSIDASGGPPSRNVKYVNNFIDGSGYASDGTLHYDNGGAGINSHQVSEGVEIRGNTITNTRVAVAVQGNNFSVLSNIFGGKMLNCVTVNRGQGHTIANNQYDPMLFSKDSLGTAGKFWSNVPVSFVKIEASDSQATQQGYLSIKNNFGYWTTAFLTSSLANTDTLYNLWLQDNGGFDTDGGNAQLITGNTTMLKHPTILNNNVRSLYGSAPASIAAVFRSGANFFGTKRVSYWDGNIYHNQGKVEILYPGPNVDITTDIVNAIAMIDSGTIHFQEGVYLLDTTNLPISTVKPLRLVGQGEKTVLKAQRGPNDRTQNDMFTLRDDIEIDGIHFQNFGVALNARWSHVVDSCDDNLRVRIQNSRFTNGLRVLSGGSRAADFDAILSYNVADRVEVMDVLVDSVIFPFHWEYKPIKNGFYFHNTTIRNIARDSTHLPVDFSRISHRTAGIYLGYDIEADSVGGVPIDSLVRNAPVVIDNCLIENISNSDSSWNSYGVFSYLTNTTITNSRFINIDADRTQLANDANAFGIYVRGGFSYSPDSTISQYRVQGNYFQDCSLGNQGGAIHAKASGGSALIADNIVVFTTAYKSGLPALNQPIGISTNLSETDILRNKIIGSRYGIRGEPTASFLRMKINDNWIEADASLSVPMGILFGMANSEHIEIIGNTIFDAQRGIDTDPDTGPAERLFIERNKFYECPNAIILRDTPTKLFSMTDNFMEDSGVQPVVLLQGTGTRDDLVMIVERNTWHYTGTAAPSDENFQLDEFTSLKKLIFDDNKMLGKVYRGFRTSGPTAAASIDTAYFRRNTFEKVSGSGWAVQSSIPDSVAGYLVRIGNFGWDYVIAGLNLSDPDSLQIIFYKPDGSVDTTLDKLGF